MSFGSLYNIGFNFDSSLVTERGHRQLLNQLNREVGEQHKQKYFPKHFQNRPETYPGAGGYRFRKRTAKWNRHKMRKVGHVTPNVYTGKLRRTVLTESKVTATSRKSSVYTRVGFRMPAWQKQEIEIISPREVKEKIRFMEQRYIELANSPKYQRKRVKRK